MNLRRFLLTLPVLGLLGPALGAELTPEAEGLRLAQEMRTALPTEDIAFTGQLKTRQKDGTINSQPFRSEIKADKAQWQAIYTVGTPEQAEALTITHRVNGVTDYQLTRKGQASPATALDLPLGNSDFSLFDLGLEFLHWPQQKIIRHEMRKGRPSRVLESQPGNALTNAPYQRVVSWVDTETGGILLAEAYNRQTQLVKQFEVKSFRKDASGQWQLQEMEIRNAQTRSRTSMEFTIKPGN
jgi:hypothetical protein